MTLPNNRRLVDARMLEQLIAGMMQDVRAERFSRMAQLALGPDWVYTFDQDAFLQGLPAPPVEGAPIPSLAPDIIQAVIEPIDQRVEESLYGCMGALLHIGVDLARDQEPYDANASLPDDTALPLDAWTAKVDAVLADCARWLTDVEETHER